MVIRKFRYSFNYFRSLGPTHLTKGKQTLLYKTIDVLTLAIKNNQITNVNFERSVLFSNLGNVRITSVTMFLELVVKWNLYLMTIKCIKEQPLFGETIN